MDRTVLTCDATTSVEEKLISSGSQVSETFFLNWCFNCRENGRANDEEKRIETEKKEQPDSATVDCGRHHRRLHCGRGTNTSDSEAGRMQHLSVLASSGLRLHTQPIAAYMRYVICSHCTRAQSIAMTVVATTRQGASNYYKYNGLLVYGVP
jgi:hypothetical protein